MAQYTVGKWSVSESEINKMNAYLSPDSSKKEKKEKKKTQNVSVTNVTGLYPSQNTLGHTFVFPQLLSSSFHAGYTFR